METVARIIEAFNFILPGGRWHLFEFCDLALYAIHANRAPTPSRNHADILAFHPSSNGSARTP